MPNEATQLEFGARDAALYVRVTGPAAQPATFAIDTLVRSYLDANPAAPTVIFDVSAASWIDSTFAGWLLRLRRRLSGGAAGTLVLAAISEPCRASLDRMRVLELFEIRPSAPPDALSALNCGKLDALTPMAVQIMADAHEALASMSEENRRIFGPIADLLRKQISAPNGNSAGKDSA